VVSFTPKQELQRFQLGNATKKNCSTSSLLNLFPAAETENSPVRRGADHSNHHLIEFIGILFQVITPTIRVGVEKTVTNSIKMIGFINKMNRNENGSCLPSRDRS
jgi:hypothetical protein